MFELLKFARSSAVLTLGICLIACGGSGSSGNSESGVAVSSAPSPSLSYNTHAKSIIDSRCVTCHHEGGQGPFSLTDYQQVESKISAIAYVLEAETMPPPGFTPLSSQEQELLMQWLEEGAAEGSPDNEDIVTPYTYYRDTKAIIEEKCTNCHSPGEIAPFSLTDYASVYAVRAAAAHQVASNAMPPWPPTNHYLRLKGNRSLSDDDKVVLLSWLEGGAPAGNPDDYISPGNDIAPIDYNLTIKINEPYTPTEHPDEYRCLMIDWPLDHTVFVDAVNVVPDAKAQVHHVFSVIVDPENLSQFEAADGADGKPGFPCWGAPSPEGTLVPPRTLTVWAPGISSGYLPEGTGVRVEPGSKIAMQMHYNTINTEPVPDQSSLELHYVESVEREALTLFFLDVSWYPSGGMPIPAGDPNVTHHYTGDVGWAMAFVGAHKIGISEEDPFALHSVFLHQHDLGAATSIELIREDGTEVMLVDIRDWDFDWQDEYKLEEEVIVQPGDRFRLTCTWDNSAANQPFVQGKQLEPQYVEFGEGTVDEMCVSYFYISRVKDEDKEKYQDIAPTVAFYQPEHLQIFSPGDYVPIELLVNAFKLQEPNSGHAEHGHTGEEEDPVAEVGHEHHTGHYHIYLDTEDDNADHLTRWDMSTYYQLPENIVPGEHWLRISLRNDDHDPVGVESRVTFIVEPPGGADQKSSVETLIDPAHWTFQEAGVDTLANHRPTDFSCPENAWYEEDGALEVETGYCNYLSLAQPVKAAINPGDNIHLVLWHGQLRFDDPSEAHVAVTIGGKVVWEDYIEIPNAGGIYDLTIPSTVTAAVGDTVEYHLHNHGYNSWTLLTLDVQR